MTEKDKKYLQKAVKILQKDWIKKDRCKEFAFGCSQCAVFNLIESFESYVNFYVTTDKEMRRFFKKSQKKKVGKK